jgi:hypothetical protein
MICPFFILTLSLALIMAMSGLYFLSYVRREGLGWLSRTVGYAASGFGIVVFITGIIAAILKSHACPCHKHDCSQRTYHSYKKHENCCEKVRDREIQIYTYSSKDDSVKRDKTIVKNR